MKRTLTLSTALGLLALSATSQARAATVADVAATGAPVVVADHLNNPRQLNLQGRPGARLVIAEAGSGGSTCAEQGCIGDTGAAATIDRPATVVDGPVQRRLTGLFSAAAPDGSFAVGADGADMVSQVGPLPHGSLYASITYAAPDLPPTPAGPQSGFLVGEATGKPAKGLANLAQYEAQKNPDLRQVDSHPYAVLVQEQFGRVLVADVAGNDVLSVDRSGAVTPFRVYTPGPRPAPEFVPTSLAEDAAGNVYVGGLGLELPGKAQVVKYSPTGAFLQRWTGFTAITGIAVDNDSGLYVSQLFGPDPEAAQEPGAAPGNVVRVKNGVRDSIDVPFPAGLAVGIDQSVFVAAYSVFDGDGPEGSGGMGPRGQLWKIRF